MTRGLPLQISLTRRVVLMTGALLLIPGSGGAEHDGT